MRRPLGPPPWLWLLLGLYVAQLPGTVTWWIAQGRDLLGLGTYPAGIAATGGFRALLALSIAQLAPTAFLAAGALAVLLPRLRCRLLERYYGLRRPVPGEPFAEIEQFLSDQAPGVELRVNSTRADQIARVYPAGPRRTRIAAFVPLAVLWRRDREAAEALLLHELGHHRAGEQHVAGLGSPFVALLKSWPYLFALCGALPAALLLAWGEPSAHAMLAEVVLVVLRIPHLLLLPVGALWTAELAADRQSAAAREPAGILRVLDAVAQADPGRLATLHHPPVRIRRWFALRSGSTRAQLLLVLLLPGAVLADVLLSVAGATAEYRLLDVSWGQGAARALTLAKQQIVSGPQWWAVLASFIVWPLLAPVWSRMWGQDDRHAGTLSIRAYSAAALVPSLVLAAGLATWGTRSSLPSPLPSPASPASGVVTAAPTTCPEPSAPAPPARPPGLPDPADVTPQAPTAGTDVPPGTFTTTRIVSAEPLLGTARTRLADLQNRLGRTHWTLTSDGTLTNDLGSPPPLRTTAHEGVSHLHGEHSDTTEVSVTTEWADATLGPRPDARHPQLVLVRATASATHAVVGCHPFDSTSTTAAVFVLDLGPTG